MAYQYITLKHKRGQWKSWTERVGKRLLTVRREKQECGPSAHEALLPAHPRSSIGIVTLLMSSLAFKALLSVLLLAVVMSGVIFFGAGHWTIGDYWQAWVYVIVFTLISLVTTIYLIRNDPE